jgi:hypothetical protein
MFFGDVPKFDEILRVVGEFERLFNDSAGADIFATATTASPSIYTRSN